MPVLYPNGYGQQMVTLTELDALHGAKQHPEFRWRLLAWLESQHGLIGIGGGWRAGGQQPDRPGFAPEGQSFHQSQRFASGILAYAAVDLVVVQPGKVHRAPTWGESVSAPNYGLHTFITGEPWHIQCVEMRGFQSWVNAGRPDPRHIALPGDRPPEDDDMPKFIYIAKPPAERSGKPWLLVADADVRAAVTADREHGLTELTIDDPGQYDALFKSAGLA